MPKIAWRLRLMLWIIKLFQKPLHQSDIDKLRKRSNSKRTAYFSDIFRIKVHRIEDTYFLSQDHRIKVRCYYPSDTDSYPTVLFFHGGGFVLGGLNGYDHFCRRLSRFLDCMVASVDYRLAPEHKYPAAHLDAWNALQWLMAKSQDLKVEQDRITVMGDSAGGNLAASLAFKARDQGIELHNQVLIYPVVDFRKRDRQYYDQFLVSREDSKWFAHQFLNSEEESNDPELSIILNENFENLPATLIIQAEYDHLNGQIDEFSKSLTTTTKLVFPGTFHGFITMFNWTNYSKKGFLEIKRFLRPVSQG